MANMTEIIIPPNTTETSKIVTGSSRIKNWRICCWLCMRCMVASDAVSWRLRARGNEDLFPVVASVAEAEREFDDAILHRRRLLLPLLSKTA